MPPTVQTPVGRAPVIPLAVIGLGSYLAWFGVHYWDSTTKWPSDPVKAVLTGKSVPAPTGQTPASSIAGQVEAQNSQSSSPSAPASTQNQSGSGAVAGGTYNHSQLQTLWTLNGGSAGTANIAAAIALAESSGRSNVTSSNPDGGTNVGLWQLDTRGVGSGYTVAQLQNPDTNARITVMNTANGTNWGPWETFHTGAYKQFLA